MLRKALKFTFEHFWCAVQQVFSSVVPPAQKNISFSRSSKLPCNYGSGNKISPGSSGRNAAKVLEIRKKKKKKKVPVKVPPIHPWMRISPGPSGEIMPEFLNVSERFLQAPCTCSSVDSGRAETGRGGVSAQEVDSPPQATQPESRRAPGRGGSCTTKLILMANYIIY